MFSVRSSAVRVVEHHLADRRHAGHGGAAGVEFGAHRVEGGGEDRLGLVQLTSHADALTALPGEEVGEAVVGACRAEGQGGVRFAAAERGERRDGLRVVLGGDGRAVVEGGTGGGEGAAEVADGHLVEGVQRVDEGGGLGAQRRFGTSGQHPQRVGAGVPGVGPGRRGRCGGLGEDDVGVGAADAEGGDTGAPDLALLDRPRLGLGEDSTPPSAQSTSSLGLLTFSVAGSSAWRSAMTILMMPPTPAAAWAWPRLDLREPSMRG
ncbi:hypothetical protein STANM309S_04119 [Streptomyces tanashiensis]